MWHTKMKVFLLSLFWRGAWHIRLEEARIGMRKEHRDSAPVKGIPRQGLANIPRQGIDKRSQAGNWQSIPGRDCKTCQAGHWQTFPGREMESVPRQGTGKRPRQGLQACPRRACTLASVPRQRTGKRLGQDLQTCTGTALANVPRQGTVDVPRHGTVVVSIQGAVSTAKV